MILFICWVVFTLVLIIAFTVAAVLEKRNQDPPAVTEEPLDESYENSDSMEDEDVVEEFEGAEEFSDQPAGDAVAADDFAAFDEEFK
ncbi:hypothetical protein CA85_04450 [Allorhodopirellula solitaria]|uniref:Uncharacterized protein n=2 Tax=Allorhodopirellula solitaria TaxID=2527987 RepID=A0A5C5YJT4_9BACT|nr:hypothetical protein CA85_04450 [Allorhodopirellula solitaria]